MTPNEESHARLLKRLALVVSEEHTYRIRLCAIHAIQASLPNANPLKQVQAEELLDSVLPPWATRPYRNGNGRFEERVVQRPQPLGLADVWR